MLGKSQLVGQPALVFTEKLRRIALIPMEEALTLG